MCAARTRPPLHVSRKLNHGGWVEVEFLFHIRHGRIPVPVADLFIERGKEHLHHVHRGGDVCLVLLQTVAVAPLLRLLAARVRGGRPGGEKGQRARVRRERE